jgi:hypothetical protein
MAMRKVRFPTGGRFVAGLAVIGPDAGIEIREPSSRLHSGGHRLHLHGTTREAAMLHRSALDPLKPFFRFSIQDREATHRFLLGSLLLLASLVVPILPALFAVGYVVRVMRMTGNGEPPSMPPWAEWGALLKDGFRAWAASFLFFLPSAVVFLIGFGAYLASFIGVAGSTTGQSDPSVGILFLVGMGTLFLSIGLGTLLFVLISIPLPIALAHFAHEDRFTAAFQFRAWWPILRGTLLGVMIAWVIVGGLLGAVYLISLFAYFSVVLICFLFLLLMPVYFYVLLVGAAMYGDLYAQGRADAA